MIGVSLLAAIAAGSCRSTPEVSSASQGRMSGAQPVAMEVMGRDNTREIRPLKAVVAASADPGDGIALNRHLQAMMKRGGPSLISDNDVRLLIDGPQAYDAMFSAMETARDHINLEVYIFRDDEVGRRLIDMLLKKQREGVQVKLIYDSLGSLSTPKSLFQPLLEAGAEVMEFNPVNPIEGKTLELNNRDHRKLLIVDGKIGFTGGINISSVYSHGSAINRRRKKNADDDPPREEGWRDTQIEIRGPAVAELQKIFFSTWDQRDDHAGAGGTSAGPTNIRTSASGVSAPNYYPSLQRSGNKFVRVIASSADAKENIIYTDLLTAIQQAQRTVHLTMAYFSPDRQIIEALQAAARRGVDVTLVLPGFSDIWLIFEAGRSHYMPLLKAGVKIYERHDALLHAKTAVIDGVWSTVGSSNMDMRSFLHNNEINAVVIGSEFGDQMETMFRNDIANGTLVTRESWSERPWRDRLRQWFSRLWAYWL